MRPYECDVCGKRAESYGEMRRQGWHKHGYTGVFGGDADLCSFACARAHIDRLEEAHNRPAKVSQVALMGSDDDL